MTHLKLKSLGQGLDFEITLAEVINTKLSRAHSIRQALFLMWFNQHSSKNLCALCNTAPITFYD